MIKSWPRFVYTALRTRAKSCQLAYYSGAIRARVSTVSGYIGFKVGLTRSGPQKSVSVNIVLEESEEDDITDVIQPVGAMSLPEEDTALVASAFTAVLSNEERKRVKSASSFPGFIQTRCPQLDLLFSSKIPKETKTLDKGPSIFTRPHYTISQVFEKLPLNHPGNGIRGFEGHYFPLRECFGLHLPTAQEENTKSHQPRAG